MHGLGDDRAGGHEPASEPIPAVSYDSVRRIARVEVRNQGPRIDDPGPHPRQLRSRKAFRQGSSGRRRSFSLPRRCPVLACRGRSSTAARRISRATSDSVVPRARARSSRAARNASSVRIVTVVLMCTPYTSWARMTSPRPPEALGASRCRDRGTSRTRDSNRALRLQVNNRSRRSIRRSPRNNIIAPLTNTARRLISIFSIQAGSSPVIGISKGFMNRSQLVPCRPS